MIDKEKPDEAWIESLRRRFPTDRSVDEALTRKLRKRWDDVSGHHAKSLEDICDLLRQFFSKRLDQPFYVTEVRGLTGGSSKEQYRFRLRWNDAQLGHQDRQFVLRLQPNESIVETHRAREAEILRALQGHLPAPDAPWCDADGEDFGQPALIMEFVSGLVKPPAEGLGEITGPKQGFGQHYRKLVGPHFMKIMTDLHQIDWRKLDMEGFDAPTVGTRDAAIRQVNWWRRVWEEDSVDSMPFMTLAANWLVDNAPEADRISIVHGDMRAGNFLFDEQTGEIFAMLDWELVHLGDRHEDLAYTMQSVFGSLDEDGQFLVNGFWTSEEFIAEYEKNSGLKVDPVRLEYYRVFHGYRSAVITLSTARRAAMGRKTHQDILLAWITGTGVIALQDILDNIGRRG